MIETMAEGSNSEANKNSDDDMTEIDLCGNLLYKSISGAYSRAMPN